MADRVEIQISDCAKPPECTSLLPGELEKALAMAAFQYLLLLGLSTNVAATPDGSSSSRSCGSGNGGSGSGSSGSDDDGSSKGASVALGSGTDVTCEIYAKFMMCDVQLQGLLRLQIMSF